MKKTFTLLLMVAIIFTLSSCSLVFNKRQPKNRTSGYIIYRIYNNSDDAVLFELTSEGRKQETIILPTEVDGHKLIQLSYPSSFRFYSKDKTNFKSDNLKYLYFSNVNYIGMLPEMFENITNLRKMFWCSLDKSSLITYLFDTGVDVYVSNNHLIKHKQYYDDNLKSKLSDKSKMNYIKPANVVYYMNDGTDECHMVDDYSGTKIITKPFDPIRKGYKFMGWYKEEECINEWDFEKDVVPLKKFDDNDRYIFVETSIYAKWQKE